MGLSEMVENAVEKKIESIKAPDGHPLVDEIRQDLQGIKTFIEPIEKAIQPADVAAAAAFINKEVFAGRFTPAQVENLLTGIGKLPALFTKIAQLGAEFAPK